MSVYPPKIEMLLFPCVGLMLTFSFYSIPFTFIYDAGCYPLLHSFHNLSVDLKLQLENPIHLEYGGPDHHITDEETKINRVNGICPILHKMNSRVKHGINYHLPNMFIFLNKQHKHVSVWVWISVRIQWEKCH